MKGVGVAGEKLLLRGVYDDKVHVFPIRLHAVETCGKDNVCAIAQETFQTLRENSLRGESTVFQDNPEICLCELPCQHVFSLYNFIEYAVLCDMRCPLCRQGCSMAADVQSVPYHMRPRLLEKLQRIKDEKENEIREEMTRLRSEYGFEPAMMSPARLEGDQTPAVTFHMNVFNNENHEVHSYVSRGGVIRNNVFQFHIPAESFREVIEVATYQNAHRIQFTIQDQRGSGEEDSLRVYEMNPIQFIPVLVTGAPIIFNVNLNSSDSHGHNPTNQHLFLTNVVLPWVN